MHPTIPIIETLTLFMFRDFKQSPVKAYNFKTQLESLSSVAASTCLHER
jgi:hypothetical protein